MMYFVAIKSQDTSTNSFKLSLGMSQENRKFAQTLEHISNFKLFNFTGRRQLLCYA